MDTVSQFVPIALITVVAAGVFLSYRKSPLTEYGQSSQARLVAALCAGLAGGFIVADPEPFIALATLVLPLFILSLYIVAILRIKRGLSLNEFTMLAALVAGGVGYHLAKQAYYTSFLFGVFYGAPLVLSVVIHMLLHKYRQSAILTKLRKTKLYRLLQADIKL